MPPRPCPPPPPSSLPQPQGHEWGAGPVGTLQMDGRRGVVRAWGSVPQRGRQGGLTLCLPQEMWARPILRLLLCPWALVEKLGVVVPMTWRLGAQAHRAGPAPLGCLLAQVVQGRVVQGPASHGHPPGGAIQGTTHGRTRLDCPVVQVVLPFRRGPTFQGQPGFHCRGRGGGGYGSLQKLGNGGGGVGLQ